MNPRLTSRTAATTKYSNWSWSGYVITDALLLQSSVEAKTGAVESQTLHAMTDDSMDICVLALE